MSYNDLNLGDTVVQGHKFVGGAQATLFNGTFPQGVQSVSITDDGLVLISVFKDTQYGTCAVILNGAVTLVSHPFNFAGRFYVSYPLKKGDTLTITNDNASTTGYVELFKYR